MRTVERTLISDIVDQQDSHRTPIVRCRDCPEPFLSRRVPYLQLYPFPVQLDCPDLEVDTDGCDEGGREGIFAESKQTA